MIKLTGVCPHCNEAVELVISKKEIKDIYNGFKMSTTTSTILSDRHMMLKYNNETTMQEKAAQIYGLLSDEEKKVIDTALKILRPRK